MPQICSMPQQLTQPLWVSSSQCTSTDLLIPSQVMQAFYYEINPLYGISCSGDGLAERSAIVSLALVLKVTSDLVLLSETDVYT